MRKLHQHKRSREQERLRKAAEPPSSENCSSAARRLLHTSPPLFFLCFLVFSHRLVGKQDLRVWWAGVAKLVLHGRILQVTHQSPQPALGEVKAAILQTHHLREQQVHISVGSTSAPWWRLSATFTTLSLGRRLQSARVSVSPSRNRRDDWDTSGFSSCS